MSGCRRDSTAGLTAPVRRRDAIRLNEQTRAFVEGVGSVGDGLWPVQNRGVAGDFREVRIAIGF